MAETGGITIIIADMEKHSLITVLLMYACAALLFIAGTVQSRNEVFVHGGLDFNLLAMGNSAYDADVV